MAYGGMFIGTKVIIDPHLPGFVADAFTQFHGRILEVEEIQLYPGERYPVYFLVGERLPVSGGCLVEAGEDLIALECHIADYITIMLKRVSTGG